jgi:uncharacterized membrane protein
MLKKHSLFAFAFVFLLLAGSAGAANLELTVSPLSVTSCSDRVLTASDVKIYIKNLLPRTDTVSLSISWVSNGYSAFIKPDIAIASGEQVLIDTIFINLPYTLQPGRYIATVKAVSSTTGETVSKELAVTVLGCHLIEVSSADASKKTCNEEKAPVSYSIVLSNPGKFDETVTLSARSAGQAISWASFSESTLVLRSGSTKTVAMTVLPPKELSGVVQTITVEAKSADSFARGSGSVSLSVEKCYDFSASVSPSRLSGCAGKGMETELSITNTGSKTDTYKIVTPTGIISDLNEVSIPPGVTGRAKLIFTKQFAGESTNDISIMSAVTQAEKKASFAVEAKECRGVAVLVSPTVQTACKNTAGVYVVSVKNTGAMKDTFSVSSTTGTLSKTSVTLDPNEVGAINLQIDTKDMETGKTMPIVVKATDGIISHQANAELSVMVCYAAEIELAPANVSLCPRATAEFSATVRNTGIKQDAYDVGFISGNTTSTAGYKGIVISAGSSQSFKFALVAPNASGSYPLYATAISPYISLTDTSTVTVKPMNVCYNLALQIGDGSRTIQTSKATVVPLTVKNTGELAQAFTLSMAGPEWVYLSPRTVQVAGGKEDKVYMYISPPYSTLSGDYKATVTALSENSKAESSVTVTVISNITGPATIPASANITAPPANITPVGNVTAPPANVTTPAVNVITANLTPPVANTTPPANMTNETIVPTENITVTANVTVPANLTLPAEGENVSVSLVQTIPNITLNATIGNASGLLVSYLPANWKTVAVIVIAIIILIILIVRFVLLVK